MGTAQEFILEMAEIVSMPEVYFKIRELMEDPKTKIGDYERIVQADPMLAIRVMRIANSHYFGFNRKTNDLYGAISLIGDIQLHDLLLGSLCMRAFYNIPEQVFNYTDFWRQGIQCGIVARSIARFCRLPASNRYFTLGLLLEIGHAAMFVKNPELAYRALLESQEQNCDLSKIERKYFGFDYCQLGVELVKTWHLPVVYPQIIGHHLNPYQCGQEFRVETEIVNLAFHYCDSLGLSGLPLSQIQAGRQPHVVILNNIEKLIAKEISDNTDEVFTMLAPPSNAIGVATGGMEIWP